MLPFWPNGYLGNVSSGAKQRRAEAASQTRRLITRNLFARRNVTRQRQESMRILADALDLIRQGQLSLRVLRPTNGQDQAP